MKKLSQDVSKIILQIKPELMAIPSGETSNKLNETSWSKKEILGHLIDSAMNNHQRFVRAAQHAAENFPPYNQTRWVEVQQYNKMEWIELIELFTQLNLHISKVLNILPEDVWNNPVNIGKENLATLEFVATDYIRHLKHHLGKILNREF
jgi:hypothetical protein